MIFAASVSRPTRMGPDAEVDGWLVSRARDGDLAAYEELVRRHQDGVLRIAYRMLGSAEDAQDTAQEVLLQMWRSLGSFRGASAFRTWLYRIAINAAITAGRRPHRQVERPWRDVDDDARRPEQADFAINAESAALRAERSRAIASAVAVLNADLRSVFVLRHFEGLTYQQIGEVLRVSEPTVRGRLARARQQLTVQLGEWR